MNKNQSELLFARFEQIRKEIEGVEFWSARELQNILGYARWENFNKSIQKALESCKNSSEDAHNHFREVTKMVDIGSKTTRELKDYALTRYACYLVAQNGDPSKDEIAFAQSYFAVQTRKQELIEKRFLENERVLFDQEARAFAKDIFVQDPFYTTTVLYDSVIPIAEFSKVFGAKGEGINTLRKELLKYYKARVIALENQVQSIQEECNSLYNQINLRTNDR